MISTQVGIFYALYNFYFCKIIPIVSIYISY